MSERQRGLGRGLSALLEEASAEQPIQPPAAPPSASSAGGVRHLPIELIQANPDQPRKNFDAEELQSLADSIRSRGVIQPIIVRPRRQAEGERERDEDWRAHQNATPSAWACGPPTGSSEWNFGRPNASPSPTTTPAATPAPRIVHGHQRW